MAAANNDKYAISISGAANAMLFNSTKSAYLDTLTADWKAGSAPQLEYDKAYRHYFKIYHAVDTLTSTDRAYEMANAAVLRQFNTGITLFKKNASGFFKPIVINVKPDPANPLTNIYTQVCP